MLSCGYNVTNLQITGDLGCIFRGFQYQIPRDYFGFPLPDDISKNLSKVAVTSVVGECRVGEQVLMRFFQIMLCFSMPLSGRRRSPHSLLDLLICLVAREQWMSRAFSPYLDPPLPCFVPRCPSLPHLTSRHAHLPSSSMAPPSTAPSSPPAFALVAVAGVHHVYAIRYSYRQVPDPNADKLWALAQIHFVSVLVVFIFTWIAFIAQVTIVGHSVGGDTSQGDPVAMYWGQAPWLVLAAAVVHVGWMYEAVRWRVFLLK